MNSDVSQCRLKAKLCSTGMTQFHCTIMFRFHIGTGTSTIKLKSLFTPTNYLEPLVLSVSDVFRTELVTVVPGILKTKAK